MCSLWNHGEEGTSAWFPGLCMLLLSRFSHVQLSATLWTVAFQAPLSMGFSRQEYWSGLPCPPPGDPPNPGIETMSLMSAALAGGFLTTSATWEAPVVSRPLHMSQEMSVWPGIEIFHHQGISDVPGQRPKVLSPSHCHLNSAEQSPDHLLLKVVQQRPRRWRPTSSSQTSIKDAHSSLE